MSKDLKNIPLTTADTVPGQDRSAVEIVDVIHEEYRGIVDDQFEVVKNFIRARARDLKGTHVVGLRFHFSNSGIHATGTVIRILR